MKRVHGVRSSASRLPVWLYGLALSVFVLGCSEAPRDRQPVTGSVTFENQPVAEGSVLFQNTAAGIYLTAEIGSDGTYQVVTHEGKGLPEGDYQVAVMPPEVKLEVGQPLPPVKKYLIFPERYRRVETSGLVCQVRDGENKYDIPMQAK